MPKSTIASRGGIGLRVQWVEPREGFRRVRGCTRKYIVIDAIAGVAAVGVSRVGAERAGIISVTSSVRPFDPIVREDKAGVCRCAREVPMGGCLLTVPATGITI